MTKCTCIFCETAVRYDRLKSQMTDDVKKFIDDLHTYWATDNCDMCWANGKLDEEREKTLKLSCKNDIY